MPASADGPLLGKSTEYRPRWTLAQHGQDVSAVSVPMRELIADIPSPGSDHRKNKAPTLLEQDLIDLRVVGADLGRHVRNIKLDRSAATRFEVDEKRAVLGAEEVAWMRFAVQQLLGSSTVVDLLTRAVQRAQEEMPVRLSERGGCVSVRDQPHSLCGSFHEVRRRQLDASHPRVQAMEGVCVFGW